jgi:hypothetical protein
VRAAALIPVAASRSGHNCKGEFCYAHCLGVLLGLVEFQRADSGLFIRRADSLLQTVSSK